MSENIPTQNVKQGALIGGVVCFALGLGIMAFSVWLVPVYGALLFAAFVLSIVAMSQKRVAGGVMLLLGCVILAPGLWLYLSMTRSARVLNKAADYIEQENRKQGIGFQTRATPIPRSTLAASTSLPSPSLSPQQIAKATDNSRTAPPSESRTTAPSVNYSDGLADTDAASIAVVSSKKIDSHASFSPAPCFSADGKRLLYTRVEPNSDSVTLTVRALDTGNLLRTLNTAHRIRTMAWSPDEKKVIFFNNDRDLQVADLEKQTVVALPLQSSNIAGDEPMVWRSEAVLLIKNDAVLALGLDDLRLTERRYDSRENRDAQIARIIATPGVHPRSVVYQQQVQYGGKFLGDYLFVANRDHSYAHPLLSDFDDREKDFGVSPDLRHVAVSADGELTVFYLGVRNPPQTSFAMDFDPTTQIRDVKQQTDFSKHLVGRVPFRARVYPPQTNPLNGKVIGPNKDRPKGWVTITGWSGKTVSLETALQLEPFSEGDIVAEIRSDSLRENGFWTFDFGEAWTFLKLDVPSPTDHGTTTAGNVHIIKPGVGLNNVGGGYERIGETPPKPRQVKANAPTQSQPAFPTQAAAPVDRTSSGGTSIDKFSAKPTELFPKLPSLPRSSSRPNQATVAAVSDSPKSSQAAPETNTSAGEAAIPSAQLPGERFPETRTRQLAATDIRTWSDVKLQYAINEMFARYGAEFGNPATAKWFSQFAWYKPRPGSNFDDIEISMMTDIERQNLQLLGAYRTAKREALKQGGSPQRDQRSRSQRTSSNGDEEEPNPLAEQILRSILSGVQKGLENRR